LTLREGETIAMALARFLKNEDGVTAIEYALMGGFIALFVVAAIQLVGTQVSAVFTEVGSGLQ
jgi:pilus assembly protein Flp/PilA